MCDRFTSHSPRGHLLVLYMYTYKQVRLSAALASLRALRPAYGMAGLSARSAIEMYVTMDSAIGSLLPRFRG